MPARKRSLSFRFRLLTGGTFRPSLGVLLLLLSLPLIAMQVPMQASSAAEPNTLVIAKSDEPNSIDPHVHDAWYSVRAQSAVYEALVDIYSDPTKRSIVVAPLLSERWTVTPDGRVYTFYLRKDVKFSDGTPLTSDDVKATFERNRDLGMRASWQVEPIASIETPDASTVVIRLKRRFTPFLYAMARAYIMSAKAIRANDQGDHAQKYFNAHMLGTGPYKFVEWSRQSAITFERNPGYWRGWSGKHFDRIVLRHVPDPSTQRLLVEKGEVDFALQIGPDDAILLRKNPRVVVLAESDTSSFDFALKVRGALKDERVRQALAFSFPYDQAISGIRREFGSRLYGPFPPGVAGFTEDGLIKYNFDQDKARALLTEAGYKKGPSGFLEKDGKPLSLELWVLAAIPFEKEVALLWQSTMRPFGVDLKVVEQSNIASYVGATYNYDSPADIYGWLVGLFIPDPYDLMRQYHTRSWKGLNASFWGDKESDALIDRAAVLPPGEARTKLYQQLQRVINKGVPDIWVWQEKKIVTHLKNVTGYVYDPVNIYPREFRYYDLSRQ